MEGEESGRRTSLVEETQQLVAIHVFTMTQTSWKLLEKEKKNKERTDNFTLGKNVLKNRYVSLS